MEIGASHHRYAYIIGSIWVFKTKLKSNGTLDRLKARVVAKVYD
jgi:hypothetical protein